MARQAVSLEIAAKDVEKYFGDFGKAIVEGSPIACALVATSVVESSLMTLLTTFFKKGSTTEGLFKSPAGLLGDLFKCAQIAYCIGLIPKTVKSNLETVAHIRNAFAHSTKLIGFDSPDISGICKSLSMPKQFEGRTYAPTDTFNTNRIKFTIVCASLAQYLLAFAPLYAQPLVDCREGLKSSVDW